MRSRRRRVGGGRVISSVLAAVAASALVARVIALAPAAAAASPLDDRQITAAVEDELLIDGGVDWSWIDVETEDGVIQLSGKVDNVLARDRAARIAANVRGARAVVNRIRVMDSGRSDEAIRAAVEEALASDPATSSWRRIGVAVSGGEVTLTGTVDSWQARDLTSQVAKGVRGVLALDNQVDIEVDRDRPDDELRAEVERTLHWDSLVDDALIEVAVRDGEVHLSGTVGSLAERNRAATDARVLGVERVDTSGLDIEDWARDERLRKGKYRPRDEDEIAAAIEDALRHDPRVEAFDVHASVDEGVVTLSGTVDNLRARQSAAGDARNTVGVWRVVNRIKVRPGQYQDDRIAARVARALGHDPYLDREAIQVAVNHGVVSLSGPVDTYFEKIQAGDVAAGTFGVVSVDNDLAVTDVHAAPTHDPYVDERWYVHEAEWEAYPALEATVRSDWEIAEDIRSQLFWSPILDEERIEVMVDDGVATLTGAVDTWNQHSAATDNAYQGGAILVDNDLTVTHGPPTHRP